MYDVIIRILFGVEIVIAVASLGCDNIIVNCPISFVHTKYIIHRL